MKKPCTRILPQQCGSTSLLFEIRDSLSTGKKSSTQENCISAPVIDLAAERQDKTMGKEKKKQGNQWYVFFDYLKCLVFCDLEK